jgi:hypothetical protein
VNCLPPAGLFSANRSAAAQTSWKKTNSQRLLRLWGLAWGIVFLVTVTSRGSYGEQSPSLRRDAAVEIDSLKVQVPARQGDSLGLALSFRYRVGRVDGEKPLFLGVTFNHRASGGGDHVATPNRGKGAAHGGAEGATHKVAAATTIDDFRDRDGLLHAKTQLLAIPRNRWREGSLFVPFFAMKLRPGAHQLTAQLSARSDAGACKAGSTPEPIRVLGDSSLNVAFTKPAAQTVRLKVTRAELPPTATDIGPGQRSRPDIQWRLIIRGESAHLLHVSVPLRDRFAGHWSRPTPPFVWSQGDHPTLVVMDHDVVRHDLLGQVSLHYSLLKRLHAGPVELSGPGLPRLQITLGE